MKPKSPPSRGRARHFGPLVTREQPHDVVLTSVQRPARRILMVAIGAAAVLHVGAAAAAVSFAGKHTAERAVHKVEPLLVIDHVIDLNPPTLAEPAAVEPPPPAPPPVEKPPPKLKHKVVDKAPEAPVAQPEAPPPPPEAPEPATPPSEPPPAAQTGQVVAAQNNAPSPAAFAIATGAGAGYVGGTSSGSGTGAKANHTGQVGVGHGNGLSRARAPQLRSRNWPCGWPTEADDLDLEEAVVVVRADIGADGSVANVEVLSDPGYGFGKRAAWCARSKVSFDPALDAAGAPIAGKTPPLRIVFVRDEE